MRSSPTNRRLAGACLVAAVLFGKGVDVRSGEQVPRWSGPIDSIGVAHQTVEAFFPELKGHQYPMAVVSEQSFDRPAFSEFVLRSFGIVIRESESDVSPLAPHAAGRHFLAGMWEFTPDGDLDQMFLQGRANHYLEYRALLDEMLEHPTWSPAQFRAAFAARQVRYWSENEREFLASVQPALEKLAALFGGTARNVHVAFRFGVENPGPPGASPAPYAEFDWHIDMDVVPFFAGRATKKLALAFEPIGGRLLRIVGVD